MKVIAEAPCRLSLFGGGTDLESYSSKYGGMVISMAINIRQHIELNDTGVLELWNGDNKNFFQKILKEFDVDNLGIKHSFDGIIESGLGSSASVAVALVGAIAKTKNIPMNRMEIAEKAWNIEVNKLDLYGGKQDQYASVWGGMNTIWFNTNGTVFRKECDGKLADYLSRHILVFYSGENRKSAKIQNNLKTLNIDQTEALHEIKRGANFARKILEYGDIGKIGILLDTAWQFKKKCNRMITNERIDRIYEEAILAGAWGGKIMGSGGGGYMFFLAEPKFHQGIIESLKTLRCINVDFSRDENGLQVRKICEL